MILADASVQTPFSTDPYIVQCRAHSILRLPLVNQTKLIGILYLENNLTPYVFTPGRVTVLKLLASQAAISLENSRLYRDLEDREGKIRSMGAVATRHRPGLSPETLSRRPAVGWGLAIYCLGLAICRSILKLTAGGCGPPSASHGEPYFCFRSLGPKAANRNRVDLPYWQVASVAARTPLARFRANVTERTGPVRPNDRPAIHYVQGTLRYASASLSWYCRASAMDIETSVC